MFLPIKPLLCIPVNFKKLCLVAGVIIMGMQTMESKGDMFGIEIPANYGQWFTTIKNLYLKNQHVITKAREMYVAYLAVSNTIDALEELNEQDKQTFKTRWRNNLRVLLETQIWFQVEQAMFEGDNGVNQLLQGVLGLQFNADGQATIAPETMEAFSLTIAGDSDYWRDIFLNSSAIVWPRWFYTGQDYVQTVLPYLQSPAEKAFCNLARELQANVSARIYDEVQEHPLMFLSCAGYDPCWSPFNWDSGSAGVVWTWEEMLDNMYRRSNALHAIGPLKGELVFSGQHVVDFDQYIHRRLCSAVWRAMGRELLDKIRELRLYFGKRRYEIRACIHDVEYLCRFLQDATSPVDSWNTSSGSVTKFALALTLGASGKSEEYAKFRSFIDGAIKNKLEIALDRAKECEVKLAETDALFMDLLNQIDAAQGRGRDNRYLDSLVRLDFVRISDALARSERPETRVGYNDSMRRLTVVMRDRMENDQ